MLIWFMYVSSALKSLSYLMSRTQVWFIKGLLYVQITFLPFHIF